MNVEQVITLLTTNGHQVVRQDALGNGLGDQLRLSGGQIVCVYNSGKVVIQGKNREALAGLFDGVPAITPSVAGAPRIVAPAISRNVFVVYGHTERAKTELEAMLRRWGLEPLILDQLTSGGATIIEKLQRAQGDANFAVVLATPDDEGYRKEHPEEKAFRVRQNVALELGMVLALLGRSRVAILLQTGVEMERPSDIQGLIYISFKDDVKEAALTLAKEIDATGIRIDLSRV